MKREKIKGTRTGFTTGACAAAAARAAVVGLVDGVVPHKVESLLPNGDRVWFAVIDTRYGQTTARAVIVKDAGDDPDVTDKAHITVDVKTVPDAPGEVRIKGGIGVGIVTKPGLGLPVGQAAINPVPRANIEANVREVGGTLLSGVGLEVTVSVPDGETIAMKTLNPRLGVIGGISILGTTGIVRPYSTAAFRASVEQGVEVARAQGNDTVVLTTGGRTEAFAMERLPELDQVCFVQMGDFLVPALDAAKRAGVGKVVIAGMAGKLVKMAQGESITHAGRATVDMNLVATFARQAGADETMADDIRQAQTARYAVERLEPLGLAPVFFAALAKGVVDRIVADYPGAFAVTVYACDFEGAKILARATGGNRG